MIYKLRFLITLIVLLALSSLSLHAQTKDYIPQGIYLTGATGLTEEGIKTGLQKSGIQEPYKKTDWEGVKASVKQHNQYKENNITRLKLNRTNLASIRQQVIGLQDIVGLQKQLTDKKASLAQIPEDLQKSLADLGYRGNYLCVINSLGLFSSMADQVAMAQQGMAATAVPELNGTFIKSVTEVENGLLTEQTIRTWVKGKMSLAGSPFYSKLSNNQKLYLLGAMVEVSPLKKNDIANNSGSSNATPVLCVNLSMPEPEVRKKLLEAGLAEAEVNTILEEFNKTGFSSQTAQYNSNKAELSQRLNTDAKMQESKLKFEIAQLETQIKNSEKQLLQIWNKLSIPSATSSYEDRVESIKNHIAARIKTLEDSIAINLGQKYEIFENIVTVTDNLGSDMARTAIGGLTQLKARKAITGYSQFVEVKNGLTTGYEEGKEIEFDREVHDIWLLVVEGVSDEYRMGMVARYRLIGSKNARESSGTNNQNNEGITARNNDVKIGNQIWMTKNLDVSTFRNGDPIPEAKTAEQWIAYGQAGEAAWCYHDNDPANGEKYGKLYNWYAVNDPRGLAPKGYHIPSDAEWTILTTYLGGEDVAGVKMKSKLGWYNDGNGTNSSGFSGLPGGYRSDGGAFYAIGMCGYWWSTSKSSAGSAWYRGPNSSNGIAARDNGDEEDGMSVRCLRD
jgi:uncharacterized protein (TIGR02145 family)